MQYLHKAIAINWFEHRRMTGLCRGLGIELHTMTSRRGASRYLSFVPRTLGLLLARRPRLVVVQNPSLALTLFAVFMRVIFRYRLVVDAHNEAVEPYIRRSRWSLGLARRLLRTADLTIVTNTALARIVEGAGGKPFVLYDPIPDTPPSPAPTGHDSTWSGAPGTKLRVAVIATYAPDEPMDLILEAARHTQGRAEFAFTGNFRKLNPVLRDSTPPNVRYTGFLEESEYWRLLLTADAILDLTLMDNCLVCGAYEAVAAGKPVILSDNPASRELFTDAAVFVPNSVAGLTHAIESLASDSAGIGERVGGVANRLRANWAASAAALLGHCRRLAGLT